MADVRGLGARSRISDTGSDGRPLHRNHRNAGKTGILRGSPSQLVQHPNSGTAAAKVRIDGGQRKSHRQPVGAEAGFSGAGRGIAIGHARNARAGRHVSGDYGAAPAGPQHRRSSGCVARAARGRVFGHRNSGANPPGRRARAQADRFPALERLANRGARLLVYSAGTANRELDSTRRPLLALAGRSGCSTRRVSAASRRKRACGAPPAAARVAFLGGGGARRNRPA